MKTIKTFRGTIPLKDVIKHLPEVHSIFIKMQGEEYIVEFHTQLRRYIVTFKRNPIGWIVNRKKDGSLKLDKVIWTI